MKKCFFVFETPGYPVNGVVLLQFQNNEIVCFYLRRSRQVLELCELLLLLLWGGGSSLYEYNLAAYCMRTILRLHKFPSGWDP